MSVEHRHSAPITVDSLSKLRLNVLNRVYIVFLILGGIAFAVGSIDPISKSNWLLFVGYLLTYLLIIIAYLGKKLSIEIRSSVLLLCIILFGVSELWYFGFGSLGYLFLYAAITIACWLVNIRWGIILLAISSIITVVISAVYSYGNLDMTSLQRQISDNMIDWLGPFLGFFAISAASISFIGIILRGLEKNILANTKYQEEIESSHSNLESNVAMFEAVINSFPEIFYMYELPPKHLVRYNENHWKMTGYTESEIQKMTIFDWFGENSSRSEVENAFKTINENESISMELTLKPKGDKEQPWLYTAKAFTHKKKKYFVGFGLNLTEQKELESKFKHVFENSKAGILLINKNGEIKELNKITSDIAELDKEQLIGKSVFDFSPNSDRERRMQMDTDLFEGRIDQIHEEREVLLPNGNRKYLDVSVGLVPFSKDGPLAVYVLVDITKQKEYQMQLEISLKEKGLLLQEVHHRVRNNLQIISSLINISSSFTENIENFKQKIALRIQAMTLMHERLSEEEGFASLDLESYIFDLIGVIYELYEIDINKINISMNIPEKIVIKIDFASSLGILINELISNAILHAFNGLERGQITISIHKQDNHLELNIKDDGIGLPDNYRDKDTFGFLMIDSLINQLAGNIVNRTGCLSDNRGTEFILKIPCK